MWNIIVSPTATLPKLASPWTARKTGRPRFSDHNTGRLTTIPTSIIPMIEPNPNTAIYVSPSDTDRADDSTINNNAADPARPWAMPIQNGRTESRHQCTCP